MKWLFEVMDNYWRLETESSRVGLLGGSVVLRRPFRLELNSGADKLACYQRKHARRQGHRFGPELGRNPTHIVPTQNCTGWPKRIRRWRLNTFVVPAKIQFSHSQTGTRTNRASANSYFLDTNHLFMWLNVLGNKLFPINNSWQSVTRHHSELAQYFGPHS